VTTILQPCAGASSSSSSALSSDQGSSEDYPEIGVSSYGSPADVSRLICMVAPNEDQPRHSSSGYPTIRRSEASDARTPSTGLVRNLNPDFNVVCVQAIMETIQRMAPDGSPLALLAQHGAEAANLVIAEKSAGVPRREPSGGHNDRARRAQVKSHLPSALTGASLEMTRGDASPRTAMFGSTAVIGMTSEMLLKIGGVSKTEYRVYLGDS
jgi:hypothetical protein